MYTLMLQLDANKKSLTSVDLYNAVIVVYIYIYPLCLGLFVEGLWLPGSFKGSLIKGCMRGCKRFPGF